MGLPRWEVAANEMGRRIYHMTWDFQDGKWQLMRWEDEFTTWHGTSNMPSPASSGTTNSGTTNFEKLNAMGSTTAGTTVGTAEEGRDTEEYETGGERVRRRNVWCALCVYAQVVHATLYTQFKLFKFKFKFMRKSLTSNTHIHIWCIYTHIHLYITAG